MGIGRFSSITTIILSASLLFSANTFAAEFGDQAGNVFAFQKRLAAKGNVKALYKLGYMYEMGEGSEANIDEAKKNYQAALEKGYEPASLRLTYLEVKEKGYDKTKNADWLAAIKKMSVGSSPEALEASFLLGQLYREGIGVKKDLQKSLDIMYRLSMEGVTAADEEITKIEAETTANDTKKKAADKRRSDKAAEKRQAEIAWSKKQTKKAEAAAAAAAQKQAAANEAAKSAAKEASDAKAVAKPESRPVQQPAAQPAAAAKAPAAKVAPAKTPEEVAKAEKRKRYEAIMKKLAEEQAEINQLQGGVVDDEF